jgi:tetratricopeptide (TPR) repeat protein
MEQSSSMLEGLVKYLKVHKEHNASSVLLDALERCAYEFSEYDDLAKTHFRNKSYIGAVRCAEKALITAYSVDKISVARYNLINVYNHSNYPELAMRYIKQSKLVDPENIDIELEKAFSLFLLNRRDEAEEILLSVLFCICLPL